VSKSFFGFLYSHSFDRHQFMLSDMVVDIEAMCYWTLGLANLQYFTYYRLDL